MVILFSFLFAAILSSSEENASNEVLFSISITKGEKSKDTNSRVETYTFYSDKKLVYTYKTFGRHSKAAQQLAGKITQEELNEITESIKDHGFNKEKSVELTKMQAPIFYIKIKITSHFGSNKTIFSYFNKSKSYNDSKKELEKDLKAFLMQVSKLKKNLK